MAYTQADLERIEKAIAQGVTSVTFSDGREVEFSTMAELERRWQFIRRQMGLSSGRTTLFAEFRKGVAP